MKQGSPWSSFGGSSLIVVGDSSTCGMGISF